MLLLTIPYTKYSTMGGVFVWYKKRIKRIFIPYLFIFVPISFVSMYLRNDTFPWMDWLKLISMLDFWLSHRGPWFIAAIIPLYAITPMIVCFMRKRMKYICMALIVVFYISSFFTSDSESYSPTDIINNVLFVTSRFPAFFLGLMMAEDIETNKTMRLSTIVALVFIASLILMCTHRLVYTYLFLVIPVMAIVSKTIGGGIKYCFDFLGNITLEIYLTNIITPITIVSVPLAIYGVSNNCVLIYFVFVIINVMVSYIINSLYKKLF